MREVPRDQMKEPLDVGPVVWLRRRTDIRPTSDRLRQPLDRVRGKMGFSVVASEPVSARELCAWYDGGWVAATFADCQRRDAIGARLEWLERRLQHACDVRFTVFDA
jgi:hypothetical protein